jgi:hypothetical protein
MSRLKRDAKLKSLSIAAGLFVSCCLAGSLNAREVISCNSPNGKFALLHVTWGREKFQEEK